MKPEQSESPIVYVVSDYTDAVKVQPLDKVLTLNEERAEHGFNCTIYFYHEVEAWHYIFQRATSRVIVCSKDMQRQLTRLRRAETKWKSAKSKLL